MQYPFLFLLIIGLMFLHTTDACGKRPARPTMLPTTVPTNSSEDTTPPSHRLPCNKSEELLTSCFHGGICFVVIIRKERNRNCQCTEEWTGPRCQELSPELPLTEKGSVHMAHIAAGVVGTVIIVLVIVFSVYIYVRVKKKESSLARRQRQNGANNTHAINSNNGGSTDLEMRPLRDGKVEAV